MADVCLNRRQVQRILFTREADRVAACTRTTGTTDTVYIVFAVIRQVIVKDVRNGWDVQAARCDVGGDQNIEIATGEFFKNTQAFFCATSPVSRPTR